MHFYQLNMALSTKTLIRFAGLILLLNYFLCIVNCQEDNNNNNNTVTVIPTVSTIATLPTVPTFPTFPTVPTLSTLPTITTLPTTPSTTVITTTTRAPCRYWGPCFSHQQCCSGWCKFKPFHGPMCKPAFMFGPGFPMMMNQ